MTTQMRPRRHRLAGELTIFRVAELRGELLGLIDEGCGLELDLSAVSEIDSAGVQLLIATAREAKERAGALTLIDPSAAVREVFGLLRLDAALTLQ